MLEIEKYKDIEILKKSGFFELTEPEQIIFLREKGFFEMSLEDRILFLETAGLFYIDINDDPPAPVLEPDKVDYLKTKLTSKIKNYFATKAGEIFTKKMLKKNSIIIKEFKGLENMKSIEKGAIVTCNHFNPFDTFSVELAFRALKLNKKKKLHIIIREGNYTNFPGFYGFLFRNFDTLPLSSKPKTMTKFLKAVDTLLQKGDFILIYPEQSMWWNYKQPKPLKDGAFKFAAKNNVPVLPTFITLTDSNIIEENGAPVQEYTLHFGEPIYPNPDLSVKQNIEEMRYKNYIYCKKTYEEFYGKPVHYTTVKHDKIPKYVLSTPDFEDSIQKNNKI